MIPNCDSCQMGWEHTHAACERPGCSGVVYQERQRGNARLLLLTCTEPHSTFAVRAVAVAPAKELVTV